MEGNMKSIPWVVLACMLAGGVAAQEPETLVKGEKHSGGFGGPTLHLTSMAGEFGALFGGRGGWIIDHRFVIGGAGRGLVGTHIDGPMMGPGGTATYLTFGYAGLELQYIHNPMKLFHATVQLLIGGGEAAWRRDDASQASSGVFVVEPGLLGTVNVARKVHFTVGATYRIVSGTQMQGLSNGDLSTFAVFMGMEFGSF
jgi:hypothetical protein